MVHPISRFEVMLLMYIRCVRVLLRDLPRRQSLSAHDHSPTSSVVQCGLGNAPRPSHYVDISRVWLFRRL